MTWTGARSTFTFSRININNFVALLQPEIWHIVLLHALRTNCAPSTYESRMRIWSHEAAIRLMIPTQLGISLLGTRRLSGPCIIQRRPKNLDSFSAKAVRGTRTWERSHVRFGAFRFWHSRNSNLLQFSIITNELWVLNNTVDWGTFDEPGIGNFGAFPDATVPWR